MSIRNRSLEAFLRSKFNKKIANWKAESLRNSVSKELAPEDASIESYSDFESDHFVVGRLRRRASGGNLPFSDQFSTIFIFDHFHRENENENESENENENGRN